MTTFVVLGMHRTGTSLVSSILHALGVNMGSKMLGPRAGNPYGHFEDVDFVQLNDEILAAAGGSWHHPPSPDRIAGVRERFERRISILVLEKYQPRRHWGYKDPRSALTIELFAPFLVSPIYVRTYRPPKAIAKSLLARHEPVYSEKNEEWYMEFWLDLVDRYERRIDAFLEDKEEKSIVHIDFNELVNRKKATGPINVLADLVKPPPRRVREAFYQVRFRE